MAACRPPIPPLGCLFSFFLFRRGGEPNVSPARRRQSRPHIGLGPSGWAAMVRGAQGPWHGRWSARQLLRDQSPFGRAGLCDTSLGLRKESFKGPLHALSTPHSKSPKWTRLLSASWPCTPAPARTHTHPPTPSGAGGGPDTVLEHLRTPGPSPSNMIARVAASAQSRSEKPCVMGVVTDDVDGGS